MRRFDLIVIGAGSGLEVVAEAVGRGWSVAVVEEGPFGGTCLNRGCIPSKRLAACADVMETIGRAGAFGIHVRVDAVDWPAIVARATGDLDGEAAAIESANQQHPQVTVVRGTARFTGTHTLVVANETLTAPNIVLAAGSRPAVPPIPGLDRTPFLTSDSALRLPALPRRLIVIGGGYIAAELAHVFGAFGVEITLVQRGPLLLSAEDEAVAWRFTEVASRKWQVWLNARVAGVAPDGTGVVVTVEAGGGRHDLAGDALLVATGRVPNTDRLGLAEVGLALDSRGFVRTDFYLRASAPGIWALGDIAGRYLLKHSANLEAAYVAHNLFHPDHLAAVNYNAMPHAVFSSPQVAGVGLTEQEARAKHVPYVIGLARYADTAAGRAIGDADGFVKVLVNPENRAVLGCHIVGRDAATLIQTVAGGMRAHLTAEAVAGAIFVHPALPEVIQRAVASSP